MTVDREHILCARLRNQFLLERSACATVVSGLCGLQAQFASNPKYALRIRGSDFDEADWDAGLVKIWSFRHTLHVVRLDELGVFLSAAGMPDRWEGFEGIGAPRAEALAGFLMEQIISGVTGREALKARCREADVGREELDKVFNGWGGLLYEMNQRGMIAYHPGTAKNFLPCAGVERMDKESARAVLLRRYFRSFGPAALEDCAAFTGYKKREIAGIIERHKIALRSVRSRGTEYFHSGSLPDFRAVPPCIFLAGFDQMIMGYKDRSAILDDKFKRSVVTVSGIVSPTVLLDGRICAKWKKDKDKLVIYPFRKLSKRERRIAAEFGESLFGRVPAAGGVRGIVFDDAIV
ncbi:MAG: winged helix DNA-binding domain-containing protein [Synergistaceae bacterium]|jgi:hypothetical protein|nr:winged helix DNA-binding domain-containing protein [Synergistaceae bacterium]